MNRTKRVNEKREERLADELEPFYDPDMDSFGIMNLARFILENYVPKDEVKEMLATLEIVAECDKIRCNGCRAMVRKSLGR